MQRPLSSSPYTHPQPYSPSSHRRTLSPGRISIASSIRHFSETEAPNVPLQLSRQELRTTIENYEFLLTAAKSYRNQMMGLAQAAAGFGSTMERLAKSRGAIDAGTGLHAASGLQYLISNHYQVLGDVFYKAFEIPLMENLDHHKATILQSEENYEKALRDMSDQIKETESRNVMSGRKGQRDLSQFRQALADLTRQVDELENVKNSYYRHMLDTEQRNFNLILDKAASIVRAQVEVCERIARKGLADPILEQMIDQVEDPFSAVETSDETAEVFTVTTAAQGLGTQANSSGHSTPRPYESSETASERVANHTSFLRDPFLRVDMVGAIGGIVSEAVEETPLRRNTPLGDRGRRGNPEQDDDDREASREEGEEDKDGQLENSYVFEDSPIPDASHNTSATLFSDEQTGEDTREWNRQEESKLHEALDSTMEGLRITV